MPTLARFYGIVIRMYFLGSEHNPPHIYAIYGEDTAAFDSNRARRLMVVCHFALLVWCASG